MKKLYLVIGALVIFLAIGQYVIAASTGTVTTTVTVQNIQLTVADGAVAYGTLAVNTSTSTYAIPDHQTVTNTGNVAEDFNIQGANATGSTSWTLAAAAGADQYSHRYCTSTCQTAGSYTALTTSYSTLATNIAALGTQIFDLSIYTPTSTADFTAHTANVVVQATAH